MKWVAQVSGQVLVSNVVSEVDTELCEALAVQEMAKLSPQCELVFPGVRFVTYGFFLPGVHQVVHSCVSLRVQFYIKINHCKFAA